MQEQELIAGQRHSSTAAAFYTTSALVASLGMAILLISATIASALA
jgi:hypothetical protein